MVRLMEAEVTQELSNRTSPAFEDPTEKGLDKMYNTSWIQDTMSKSAVIDDDLEVGEPDTVVNLDYDLQTPSNYNVYTCEDLQHTAAAL